VYCWGGGGNGQLGNAASSDSPTPVRAFGAFVFESVDAGLGSHTCAVTTTDAAICWGAGWSGQVGDGNFNSVNIPTNVSGGLAFAEISAGSGHSCGRTTGGDAYCWGTNYRGAIGTGDPLTIQPAFALGGASSVTAGEQHTCIIGAGGSATCFGEGGSGQLGQGIYQSELNPVAVTGGFTFVSVAGGTWHTCGLETSPGNIYCWGSGGNGQLGNGSFNSTNAPATMVTGGHSFVEVDAGQYHSCGVTDLADDVYCWGENSSGQLGDNSATRSENPVLVSGGEAYATVTTGRYHSCALTIDGLAHCWGENGNGQLGDATNTQRLAPVAVAGGATFTQIAAGGWHTCALDGSGGAYCWGQGWNGQIGNNQFNSSNVPQAVAGGFTFTDIIAGGYYTCAIRSTGETMCWGDNGSGELGDGTFNGRGIPTAVSGGLSFTDLDAGWSHTCGVTAGGSLYCWGDNSAGELGLGFTSQHGTPTMVAGGLTFVRPPPEER
jgi:alpha-tubulin suppressor-like RCC1 family protein